MKNLKSIHPSCALFVMNFILFIAIFAFLASVTFGQAFVDSYTAYTGGSLGSSIELIDGSYASPALTFTNNETIGMYRISSNNIGWAISNHFFRNGGAHTVMGVENYSSATGYYNTFYIRKSEHATIGSLGETSNTSIIGQVIFQGVGSNSVWSPGAYIQAYQSGAATTSIVPTRLELYTYGSSGVNSNQLILGNDGDVGIGTAEASIDSAFTIAGGLHVTGGIKLDGGVIHGQRDTLFFYVPIDTPSTLVADTHRVFRNWFDTDITIIEIIGESNIDNHDLHIVEVPYGGGAPSVIDTVLTSTDGIDTYTITITSGFDDASIAAGNWICIVKPDSTGNRFTLGIKFTYTKQ